MKWIRDSPSESWSDKNAHLLLILVGLAVLSGLGCDRCGYALEERSSPPDGSNRAVILQPDCRATTDLQSHVSLLSIGKRLAREKGNVFIADGNHGVIPFDSHGVMDLDVVCKSDSQIEITYPPRARIFLEAHEFHGIRVSSLLDRGLRTAKLAARSAALAITLVPPLSRYKISNFFKNILHLRQFPVISLLRTNFAEMPGKSQPPGSREQKFKGDAVVRVSRSRRQP